MNRSQFPNGGWQFFQQQTGWWAPAPVGNTFDQQVTNIIKHRLANRAVTAAHKLSVDVNQVGIELESFNARRLGLPDPKTLPPPVSKPSLSGAVQDAVAAVRNMATGAAVLFEWEKSGLPPVEHDIAVNRAAICVTCPKNDKGGFTKLLAGPIAEMYRKKLERLHALKLETTHDNDLHVCSACDCPLPLKVFAPDSLILKYLTPEQRGNLDARCWILNLK